MWNEQVNAEAAQIMKEAVACNIIAAECQVELDKAMPALMAAEAALNVLTKKDMSEVKAYAKPPALVEMTLNAVMTVLKRTPTWAEAKLTLGDSQFLDKLMNYNKDLLVTSTTPTSHTWDSRELSKTRFYRLLSRKMVIVRKSILGC